MEMTLPMLIVFTYLHSFVTIVLRGMSGVWQGRGLFAVCWASEHPEKCLEEELSIHRPWRRFGMKLHTQKLAGALL
jgi:hypothetical protein